MSARRITRHKHYFHHWSHIHASPLSPLSLASIVHATQRLHFGSDSKKSKIKVGHDEFADVDALEGDEEEADRIEDATIEKETIKQEFRQNAKKTIYDVQFSASEQHNQQYSSSTTKWLHINIGLDNILPRMMALHRKGPDAIVKLFNLFYISNAVFGVPIFMLCWKFKETLVSPELIFAYLFARYSSYFVPFSSLNRKLVQFYQTRYPLLHECRFSRKLPDPSKQCVNAFAEDVMQRVPFLRRIDVLLEKVYVGRYMKRFRRNIYSNAIEHGFAWDVADNTRFIVFLPLTYQLLHSSGLGAYLSDAALEDTFGQCVCCYIGAAFGARVMSHWTMRAMALMQSEKQFGLRSDAGVYYGTPMEADTSMDIGAGKRKKHAMHANDSDVDGSTNSKGKISSRK
eukprot:CAMPEP_0202731868 /NCGR_PEP_ID=MMETSP1385-20130828/187370_1 /ASSEMBLY_ACC=CAM_ASM_000861 /TAXON_ID=933848 /ORGANISM="Elphidium margaritaceum" /LENGTH=399 /DNA_ID=CAMNT_0049398171 /DNA_START=26 /DNA_END=1222 /DNA_ORIENTATION=-